MKKISIITMACSLSLMVQAQLIDDFSGGLGAYTLSRVLDNDTTANISFSNPGGALQANATATSQAEQVLFLRSDFSLGVGQKLVADVNWALAGSQDLGIVVAATATPATVPGGSSGNVRSDYIFSAMRSTSDHAIANGFNGAAALTLAQVQGGNPVIGLFIARTSLTTFDMGYDKGAGLITMTTFTVANANIGNAVGFYSDMRTAGSIGGLDNLRIEIIPEPSLAALAGLGALGFFFRSRRK